MIVTSEQLFDFQRLDTLVDELAVTLIMKAKFFKEIYKKTAPKFPEIIINFCFSTKGSTSNIHPSVKIKEVILVEKVAKLFSTAKAKVCFLYYGAKELLELNRSEKPYTLTLNLHENPIVAEDGYLAIVKITDYYKFITDETGKLRNYIFDLNVRDYQGPVEVNQDIENSLDNDRDINFWILNNGVTVIADRGSAVAKDLTLENVQIVNGLQTSTCIYKYLTKNGLENEKRSILVKIVIKEDQTVIDKVIKAANFQTPIAIASLKATDLLQREIEEYFKKNDLFYDRRKGYYKNIGKPSERIVSIPFLAQSVITIVYREPDLARSRPSSLIKKDVDYNKVFSSKTTLPIYLFCAKFMLRVQSFLRRDFGERKNVIKNNFKFHIV
jgi:hypothetical protein